MTRVIWDLSALFLNFERRHQRTQIKAPPDGTVEGNDIMWRPSSGAGRVTWPERLWRRWFHRVCVRAFVFFSDKLENVGSSWVERSFAGRRPSWLFTRVDAVRVACQINACDLSAGGEITARPRMIRNRECGRAKFKRTQQHRPGWVGGQRIYNCTVFLLLLWIRTLNAFWSFNTSLIRLVLPLFSMLYREMEIIWSPGRFGDAARPGPPPFPGGHRDKAAPSPTPRP